MAPVFVLRWGYRLLRAFQFVFRPVTLGVRVMMIKDGNVLLVRHTYIPGWAFPGGAVNRGETLDMAARREAREETGAELHSLSLVGAYTNFKEWKSDHNVLFLSTDFTLGGKSDNEIAELRMFPLDDLPEGTWAGHRARLAEFLSRTDCPQFGEW